MSSCHCCSGLPALLRASVVVYFEMENESLTDFSYNKWREVDAGHEDKRERVETLDPNHRGHHDEKSHGKHAEN
jgi:hypothetical protein